MRKIKKKESKKPKKDNKIKKIKKSLVSISLLSIIAIIIIYILYTLINLVVKPTDIFMVKNGKISFEEGAVGYVIREEVIAKGENYENGLVQIKTEGEKIAKNDPVFRYYNNDEENIKSKIAEINIKIQSILTTETDLFSSDIKSLENQIENKTYELKSKNDIQEITEYKRDINTYITKIAQIKGELSTKGSELNKLITEKLNHENQLKSNSEYINAPIRRSGII